MDQCEPASTKIGAPHENSLGEEALGRVGLLEVLERVTTVKEIVARMSNPEANGSVDVKELCRALGLIAEILTLHTKKIFRLEQSLRINEQSLRINEQSGEDQGRSSP